MIDAHTHFFSEEASADVQSWGLSRNEKYWSMLVGERPDGKLSLQGFPNEKKFLNDMDEAQIERAFIMGWYWQNYETCVEENLRISALVKRHPDRLSAFAAILPTNKKSIEIAKTARDMGFCGLGELHDGVQNFSFKSPIFEEILQISAIEKLAINIHITENTPRMYQGKTPTKTAEAIEVAKKHLDVNFIFAHWCGNLVFENIDDVKSPNIFFDSAATQFIASKDAFSLAEGNPTLANSIIYGTDYPLRLYPKLFKEEEMTTAATFARNSVSKNFAKNLFTNNCSKAIKIL
ncbi:MAG: amidohydrolase family protein [Opitutales bacterium]|nr:amidohydrolase family protein [Opitutales bacterium]